MRRFYIKMRIALNGLNNTLASGVLESFHISDFLVLGDFAGEGRRGFCP